MSKTLVIAEPGCTHEGSKDTLLELLHTAKACGADVWKPQWTSDPVQMCERRHIGPDHPKRDYYLRAYSWLSWPVEWHAEFKAICVRVGLKYACTVFLPSDVKTVAPYVDYLKIASFELNDISMHEACALAGKSVIASYGMCDPGAVSVDAWCCPDYRLHCVSAYPSPLGAMNILAIDRSYGFDGLSDHSRHLLAGALAVACGAEVVETHYRLDSCDPNNPDYAVAFPPAEFTQYIQNIRDAEIMLGSGVKQIQECERAMLPYRVTG
jgi:sialic acid synthase SpsE